MEALVFRKILYLAICTEYFLLTLFLLYNLKSNFNSSKLLSYFSLFNFFSVILCILKIALFTYIFLEVSNLSQQMIGILVYSVYYTVFNIISLSWYLILRSSKYIKYDFSLSPIQRQTKLTQIRRFFISSVVIVYLIGFTLIALIFINYVEAGETYMQNLPVNGYNLITRVALFTYLLISGLKLLNMIKKYSTVRPTKLIWNIYIIIAMVGIYIPYHGISFTIDLFHQGRNNDELLLEVCRIALLLLSNNILNFLPIFMFGSNVKLLKEFTKSSMELSTMNTTNELADDSDSSIINLLLNKNSFK